VGDASAVRFRPLIEGAVAPLLAGAETVALVGFPHHWNIGDSVIWAGALEMLRSLGVRVGYACTPSAYDPAELRRHVPDGPVLITGGGNFGDVYLDEVALRRRVLEDFPDRRVIQLPQSIWLRSREGREELQRLVDAHPAFTLLVRERRSLDMARALFQAPCLLCPDLALALEGRLPAAETATRDVTGLVRGDVESLGGSARAIGAGFADWPREEPPWRDGWSAAGQRAWDAVTAWHGRRDDAGGRPALHAALEAYETLARERTHAGAALLCSGRIVVSDRLHAALVAWLGGRQAVLVDSVSGKSRSTLETWFTGVAGMHAAPDWDAGLDLAARLGAAPRA
jgi:pyruvyl transferase EpsO